ncbi:3-ketosteroid-delta-1-dehydrogenase [Paractinoplanes abujensis]|uniref:3-oxosteroid 1-dehydrogenase n=1 Tax=Paractinoplanes abujensis TaxID=882441 RepID=A0A7W7CR14_9ACTN|nr:FAD-dependent oxidoreductase [Actinoplanes abujensis]MBB4691341.1 succinate dehydrogenase/fumarate reductase flavoprotein subunit [Actinoplanes abujensis]GID17245.1 3-ketosteroid-delta-1-dehydrogenase [Actinoplanes abujensis]
MDVDFVVVGSGTGMMAALAAAEAGLSVLIVEKSHYFGGSTALSGGGFWVPGNALLREAGVADSSERAREYLRHVTAGETPEERWQTHLAHGPAAVDLLRRRTPLRFQWMTGYADYFPELPGGSATGRAMEPQPFDVRRLGADRARLRPAALAAPFPMPVTGRTYKWLNLVARHPRGIVTAARLLGLGVGGLAIRREYVAGGSALAAGLFAGVRAAKIPVWFESPLKDLVIEDGRVCGVVVTRNGQDETVRAARGVLLSAGGFDRNRALRHEHQSPQLDTDWCLGNPENTGDVLPIARAAGADLAFMNEAWWFPAVPVPGPMPGPLLAERSLPGQIIVDQQGRRFMNEAVNYMSAGQIMIQQQLPVWMIFDQRYRNRYVFAGSVFPRQPLPRAWYDSGLAAQAPTLDDLAAQLGLTELPATVERFNAQAAAGRDDDFHRGDSAYDRYYGDPTIGPNPCLGPIDRGPFYAVQVVPGDLGTCGGIRADGFARALRPDGSVIEGLYATGNAAGNAFGRVYPGPGATIGQGLSFGYTAARHAAGKLTA